MRAGAGAVPPGAGEALSRKWGECLEKGKELFQFLSIDAQGFGHLSLLVCPHQFQVVLDERFEVLEVLATEALGLCLKDQGLPPILGAYPRWIELADELQKIGQVLCLFFRENGFRVFTKEAVCIEVGDQDFSHLVCFLGEVLAPKLGEQVFLQCLLK